MKREQIRPPSLPRKILLFLQSRYLAFLLRVILGGLFVAASWDKILHPARFVEDVANYGILPPLLVNLCALILPWLEMIAGLFLVLGFFPKSSALILSLLLASFTVAISINIARGAEIDCGCFGAGEELSWATLLRDLLLLAMAIQIFVYDQGFLAVDALWNRDNEEKKRDI